MQGLTTVWVGVGGELPHTHTFLTPSPEHRPWRMEGNVSLQPPLSLPHMDSCEHLGKSGHTRRHHCGLGNVAQWLRVSYPTQGPGFQLLWAAIERKKKKTPFFPIPLRPGSVSLQNILERTQSSTSIHSSRPSGSSAHPLSSSDHLI